MSPVVPLVVTSLPVARNLPQIPSIFNMTDDSASSAFLPLPDQP